MTWTRYTTAGRPGTERPTDVVELGPGEVAGLDRRLIGEFDGQRILELGTGAGHSAIAMATGGARVVAIDSDEDEIAAARRHAELAEVSVEFHVAEPASLAFLQADIFDVVVSVHALAAVADLGRVFRQVHRVLKPERPLVITLPHPAALMMHHNDPSKVVHRYDEDEPIGKGPYLTHRHTIGDVFTLLVRSNFRVDTIIEPRGDASAPASVVFRARKVGT